MVILYHGTRCSSFNGVATNGFLASGHGRLGPGVYFTTKECAQEIGQYRGSGTGFVVFRVEVNLGRTAETGTGNDGAGSWANGGYNSAHGTHPAWVGLPPFPEWCVRNPGDCRVLSAEVINGTVSGCDNPALDIYVSGNCLVNGDVTCRNMYIGGRQP